MARDGTNNTGSAPGESDGRPDRPAGRGAPAAPVKRPTAYPAAVDRLISEFTKLPGIGRRSAERLAFYILKADEPTALALARGIADVKRTVRNCRVCSNLSDAEMCPICADPGRDRAKVLVVEQPKDLIALEQTGMYSGLYHVLMGRLSPLDGIGPGELTVAELLHRIDHPSESPGGVAVREVILGLNPTLEGDGTSLYLAQELRARPVEVSRLARGLPTGSPLEYANKAVLADAIQARRPMER